MTVYQRLALLISLVLIQFSVFPIHAADLEHGSMGGYISYTYLGNNKLQIFVHFYAANQPALNKAMDSTHSQTGGCKVRCNLQIGSYSETIPLNFDSKSNPAYPCFVWPADSYTLSRVRHNLKYIYKYSSIIDLGKSSIDSFLKIDSMVIINTEYQWGISSVTGDYTINTPVPYSRFTTAINIKSLYSGMIGLDFTNGHNVIFSYGDSTSSYHPGAYPQFGDSVFFELLDMETDSKNTKPSYNFGLSGKYPIPTLCASSSTFVCSPNLNRKPLPTGFYFNSATGEITLVPKNPAAIQYGASAPIYFRGHIYHKNINNKWVYQGYSSLLIVPFVYDKLIDLIPDQIGVLPTMNIPRKIEICESDTATIEISTRAINSNFKDTAYVSIEGNITTKNYNLLVDYSKPYLPKILLKIWTNPNDPNNGPALLSVRLSKKLKFGNCNTIGGPVRIQTVEVVFRKKFQPEISTVPGPCNGITAKTLDKVPGVLTSSTWKVYKDSISKTPLAVYSSSNFTLKGVDKAKYYFVCTVKANKAACSEKTLTDSVNMIANWPNINFSLNQTTRCSQDSSQAFYPVNMVGFASNKSLWWETDSTIFKADTLFYSSFTSNRILLRITDTAGCDLSKEFILEMDSLRSITLSSQLLCFPQNKSITFTSAFKNYHPRVSWECISSDGDTSRFKDDSSITVYFKSPKNRIIAHFVSNQGCKSTLETAIQVDTTQIYVGKLPQLCKHDKSFNLSNLPIIPANGFWNSALNTGEILDLTSITTFPTSLPCYYFVGSSASACEYIDTQYLLIQDTITEIAVTPEVVCAESREISLDSLFKPTFSPGKWSSLPTNNLSFSATAASIQPRNSISATYTLYYHYNKDVCSNQTKYNVTISPRVIDITANSDRNITKINEPINFTAKNLISSSSIKYRWIFGDSLAGVPVESTDQNPTHRFKQVGLYYPVVYASTENCWDSAHLPQIRVELLGTSFTSTKNRFQISPNPFNQEIWINSQSDNASLISIIIYNSHGKTVYQQEKMRLPLSIPSANWSAGIYYVQVTNLTHPNNNSEITSLIKTP